MTHYYNAPPAIASSPVQLQTQTGQQQMTAYPMYTNVAHAQPPVLNVLNVGGQQELQKMQQQYAPSTSDNDEFLIIHKPKTKPSTLKKKLRDLVRYARWRRLEREVNAAGASYTVPCDLKLPLQPNDIN